MVMCLLGIIEIFNDTFDEVFTAAQLAQMVKYSEYFEHFQQSVNVA